MKKLILPLVLLILFFIFASTTLKISDSLPPGTVIPDEVKQILSPERIDKAIIYSNFTYGWYFFNNILSFIILFGILALSFSPKIRNLAEKWAEKLTSGKHAPLVMGSLFAFIALLVTLVSATPEHPVSAESLGLVLIWGLVGMFVGLSSRFALTTFYILLFFALLEVLNFPFTYYRSFVVEHRFGLSTETFGKWFADLLKGNLVSFLLSVLLIPLAYWVIRKVRRWWWALVAVGSVPIMILMLVIAPVYLDPLFNKYEPLKDEALRTQLLDMAEQAGISGSRVFQVDKSKETNKVNAYVTGLFGSKRIVLWDTILEKLTPEEITFVMGHEMGHYVLNHVWKFIAVFAVTLFVLLFIISRSIGFFLDKFGDKMGIKELADISSLPLLLLMFSLLAFIITPMINAYSRSNEHQADVFGLDLTKNGEVAASAFVKLANENLSNPSPPAFVKFWLFTHPTLKERIDFCKQYAPVPKEEAQPSEPVEQGEMTEKKP